MSFDWRTDEDDGWQEKAKPTETAVAQSFWRRRWRFLLFALLGLAAVWGVVQWQVDQRLSEATVSLESELLATHNFILETAVSQDEALFKANLSGRNPDWGEVQKRLLEESLLLGRPMLGWQHEAVAEPLTLEEIAFDIAPDLRSVELQYPQSYAVQTPAGITETVTLQHTAVYRLGTRRWLYSPPFAEFWGDWITQGGETLTLAYTERDRDVAARLAVDLDGLVGQMCSELADLNCGSDLRVHLRLDTDPASLLRINEVETMLKAGLRLELPTPTLLGLPTDEASYEALYRAYGVQVATAVLAHQIEYDCCRHQLFFRGLRDYQLAELGLQAWPLDEAMFGQMLSAGFDGNALSHWTRRWQEAPPQFLQVWVVEDGEPIWQQVYMLIEYLNEQETAVSPTQMMRLLSRNSYHGWLADVLVDHYEQDLFPTLFLEYISAQSSPGQQAEPPVPFPKGEIVLVCNDYQYQLSSGVYAFDLVSHTWVEKFPNLELPRRGGFINTQDGRHFVVTEHSQNGSVNTFYLVTEEGKLFLEEVDLEGNRDHYVYYYVWDLAANYLLRQEYDQDNFHLTLRSLDCPTADCPEIELGGYPLFSPDGQYLIENVPSSEFVEETTQDPSVAQYDLFLVSTDGEVRRSIGRGWGWYAFWLNEATYGFARADNAGWELMMATLFQSQPRILLQEADLLAEIPSADGLSRLFINNIFAIPNRHELIIQVRAALESDSQNYLFRLHLTDDLAAVSNIELLLTNLVGNGFGYSPDGRYLIFANYNYSSSSGNTAWTLLDQQTNELSEPIVSLGYNMSWSPDGQWFVQNTENYLLLQAPAYDYQYYIPHGLGECQQALLSVDE